MKSMLEFFIPQGENSYFDELRIHFFIRLCFLPAILLPLFLMINFFVSDEVAPIFVYSKLLTVLMFLSCLLLVKYKGIDFAGNFMSISGVIILLGFMNIFPENMDAYFKFTHGFYSTFGYVIVGLLFARRPIILFNVGLTLLSTSRICFVTVQKHPELSDRLISGYMNFVSTWIAVTVVIYFTQKFSQLSIDKANKELNRSELQNKELLTSEEEIRASNEELVATTDALVESNQELNDALKKSDESDRLKTEFLNNMSHEVRTPMNGIIGFSQLLDTPDISESSRTRYINTIQQSSNQLLTIIDNIIEISKLGTKQVKVIEGQVHLNKMLRDLFEVFYNELKDKPVSLDLVLELDDDDDEMFLDEIKLYKILSNLLENAVKFTEHGQISFGYIVLKDHSLDYTCGALQFFVKDTGIGILEEQQELIFNKFSQADKDLSRIYGGLGLGLSIAKENTELLGGKISINSLRLKGSTFFVTIPFKPVSKV